MNQSNEGSKEPLKVRRKPFRSGGPRDSAFSTRLGPALPVKAKEKSQRRPAPTTAIFHKHTAGSIFLCQVRESSASRRSIGLVLATLRSR
jgi:hypothetical protein